MINWISIKNERPAVYERRVLVYSKEDGINIGCYLEGERWRVEGVKYPYTPTHWAPIYLPEGD